MGSGHNNNTVLIISNDEINDIIKIVKSLEDSGLLLKGVTETVQNEVKGQKGGFLSMLLGTLGSSILGYFSTGKEIYRAGKGKGVLRAGYGNNKVDLSPYPLTNFEIQEYYKNEPRFNGVYPRDNLPKIKDGAYTINIDEHYDIETHWVALKKLLKTKMLKQIFSEYNHMIQ